MNWDNESAFYTFGFGIGTALLLNDRLNFNIEATSNHITKQVFTDDMSMNLKGYLGLEVELSSRFSLAGGVTYNSYYVDRSLLADPDFDNLREKYIMDTSSNLEDNCLWRSWIGYTAWQGFSL